MDYYNNNGNQFGSGSNNDNRVNDFLDKLRDSGKLDEPGAVRRQGYESYSESERERGPINPADNADVVIYNSQTGAGDSAELRRSSNGNTGSLNKKKYPSDGNKGAGNNSGVKQSDSGNGEIKKKKKKKKEGKAKWWKVLLKVALYGFCVMSVAICALTVWVAIYLAGETKNDAEILDLNSLKLSYATQLMADNNPDPEVEEWVEYQRIFADENRIWVDYDQFPDVLKEAVISQEDQRFMEHDGVDLKRTIAAMLDMVLKELGGQGLWDETQGGSTITQQLVKNITDEDDVSGEEGVLRKVREIYRAYQLERRFTKEQILEAYLNTFRLGGQVAGIESAANYYFGVHTKDLTAAQSAAIICITKAPTANNPFINPDTNKYQREDVVLWLMNQYGYLSSQEYEDALKESEGFVFDKPHGRLESTEIYTYFTDTAIDSALEDLTLYCIQQNGLDPNNDDDVDEAKAMANNMFFNGGLTVYLTVDPFIQEVVDDVATNGPVTSGSSVDEENRLRNQKFRRDLIMQDIPLDELEKDEDGNPIYELDEDGEPITTRPAKNQIVAAIVVMDYNGRLLGVAGGIRGKTINRGQNFAVNSVRQTGSSMKPLAAYCLPLEYDYISFSEGFPDKPTEVINGRAWPVNISGEYRDGLVSVAEAIEVSLNTIAVQAMKRVGAEVTYDFLENNVGISSLDEADKGPSMALGGLTYGISPYEMCAAYTIFGNDGTFTEKHCYTKIEDSRGNIIINKEANIVKNYAISPQTAYIMNRLLQGVMNRGTGTGAYPLSIDNPNGLPYAGKSGTSSDYKDMWFIGMNPYYVCAIWEGFEFMNDVEGDVYKHGGNINRHPGYNPSPADNRLLFKTVMARISYDLAYIPFQPGVTGISSQYYCRATGDLASGACTETALGFYKGNTPGECQHNLVDYINEHTEDAPTTDDD